MDINALKKLAGIGPNGEQEGSQGMYTDGKWQKFLPEQMPNPRKLAAERKREELVDEGFENTNVQYHGVSDQDTDAFATEWVGKKVQRFKRLHGEMSPSPVGPVHTVVHAQVIMGKALKLDNDEWVKPWEVKQVDSPALDEESSEYDHLIGQDAEMMSGGIAYQGTVREVVQSSSGEWRAKVQLFGGNPDKYFWKPVEEFNESINEAPVDGEFTLTVNGKEHETADDLASLLSMAKNDLAGDDWDIYNNQSGELMYDSDDWMAPGTPEYKDPEPESEPEDDYDDYDDYDNQPAISDEEAMKIARQIEMNFGETFPDGDPIDLAMRMIHQAGFGGRDMWDTNPEVSEKVQDAFEKLTGEDGYYGYHDMLLRQMQDDNPDDEQWQNQTFANEEINDLKTLAGIKESEKEMNEDQSHDDLVNRVNDYDQKFMHDKRYSKVAMAWMMEMEDLLAGDDEMGSPERYIDDIDDWELGQLLELGDSLEHRITGIEEHREPFAGRPRGGPHLQNDYWDKSDDELEYISKDAGEARDANDEMSKAEYAAGNDHPNSNARRSYGKYADQHHDANTVRRHRRDKQPEGSYSYLKKRVKAKESEESEVDEGMMDKIKGAFSKKQSKQSNQGNRSEKQQTGLSNTIRKPNKAVTRDPGLNDKFKKDMDADAAKAKQNAAKPQGSPSKSTMGNILPDEKPKIKQMRSTKGM